MLATDSTSISRTLVSPSSSRDFVISDEMLSVREREGLVSARTEDLSDRVPGSRERKGACCSTCMKLASLLLRLCSLES